MSVSINYKNNEILSIPTSGDYKLNTKGKYLEDDIRITATSGGSAAIITDTTDAAGGTIREITTTNELYVAPKTITQNGTYSPADDNLDAYSSVTVNVGGGGNPWVRPSSWPDLSKMDISDGDILYMTSYADEARGFCSFSIFCTGSYTVEVGTISGSTFTAESTQTYISGSYCQLYYGSANGTYKVLRVMGAAITKLTFKGASTVTIDDFYGYGCNQGIIDIVGKLPSGIELTCSSQYNLVNVEISGLTLEGAAFNNCYSLTSLDVSNWDTSAVTNMSTMFSSCYSLTSIDVSNWDTSAVTNMSTMFNNCNSLTFLDVSEWDTSAVTSMAYMFGNCYSLTSLDVSKWDTAAVTDMNTMFYNCNSLTFLDVSEWDTAAVTSMYYMFGNCYSLTSLDVSNWDTSAVTDMSDMFYNCYTLTSLDVSNWDTSAVKSMSNMFYYCNSLTFLDVSEWDFSLVTTASNTTSIFRYCRGLHGSITLPASMTMIGTYCFADMRSIYEWHFLATTPPTLNNTNAFNNMTDFGGKKIYVPSASLAAYQTASNWSTYASYMVGE